MFNSGVSKKLVDQVKLKRIMRETACMAKAAHGSSFKRS